MIGLQRSAPAVGRSYRRRMLGGRALAAVAMAAFAAMLSSPAALAATGSESGEVDPFAEYSSLAQEQRTPAPLIPIVMPGILGGGEAAPQTVFTGAGGVYSLAFNHYVAVGPIHRTADASILLQDLGRRSVAGRREFFGSLYTYRKTRVRGHKGLLLRARYSPVRSLVWREDGRLYELSTNTPRTIGTGVLRAVASGLAHLRAGFTAQVVSADGGIQEAEVLLGDRSAYLRVSWTSPCTRTSGEATVDRSGTVGLGWVGLGAGGPFARSPFSVAGGPSSAASWTFSANGTVALGGGQVTFQATSAAGAESCSVGPLALPLVRLPLLRRATS